MATTADDLGPVRKDIPGLLDALLGDGGERVHHLHGHLTNGFSDADQG
ncbi:hypothetical protein ACFWPV_21320 [Streptomyces uncialis]